MSESEGPSYVERNPLAMTAKQEVLDRFRSIERVSDKLHYADDEERLKRADAMFVRGGLPSVAPILPRLFNLKGRPYTLDSYFPFEPFFRTRMPQQILLLTGRQVSKSTSLAARSLTLAASVPYINILHVTPLFEQIRRFSTNYVDEFVKQSPVRRLFRGQKSVSNVLQKTFANNAKLHFSFAFLNADRTRGLPCDVVGIDEIQDIQADFLPIIYETLSGSPWNLILNAGTPKSLNNTANQEWRSSSQGEFLIKCAKGGCNYWNVPMVDRDLMDMIGEDHEDIGREIGGVVRAGVVCAKCKTPLDPKRHGRWIHAVPERKWTFAGYHVPQIVMPFHYASRAKWSLLCQKRDGFRGMTFTQFLNEVCGVAWDEGSKLVTETDLRNAAILPWKNVASDASKRLRGYTHRVLAVDWGGGGGRIRKAGGKKEGSESYERRSYTSLAVLGYRPDGKIDVIWGHRSTKTYDRTYEAALILEAMALFKCSHLVHDYNGAGGDREAFIVAAGVPINNIVPVKYHGAASHNFLNFKSATDDHPRNWLSVDKSYSLGLTCQCIKFGLIRFFQYDHVSRDEPGLLHDFLALVEEKVDSLSVTDLYRITRDPAMSDDFAQAVNIGCCALWYMNNAQPDIAAAARLKIPKDLIKNLHPTSKVQWDDI